MFLFLIEEAKFPLGQIVATPGALRALEESGQEAEEFVKRHALGDWGELCAQDLEANEQALKRDTRLLSRYTTSSKEALYVITEWDRSLTTILLPEEY